MTMQEEMSRQVLFYTSLAGALLSVAASYPVSSMAANHSAHVGTVTLIQYAATTIAMFLAMATFKPECRNHFIALVVVAVICRLLLVPIDAYTSNDIARYLFDGKLALEGFDPYRVSHDAAALVELRSQWQPPAEHAAYVTLYPPFALGLFSLAASFGVHDAFYVWKFMAFAAGVLTLAVTALLLTQLNRQRFLPLVALSPLLIFETGVGGHLDAFSTLLVALALCAFFNHRIVMAGVFIGLGTLTKLLPLAIALPIFFTLRLNQQIRLVSAIAVTLAAGYGALFWMGFKPIGSIGVFFAKWRFGSPIFDVLSALLQGQLLTVVLVAIFLSVCLWIAFASWQLTKNQSVKMSVIPYLQIAVALPLLISPVVFPWYLMPLVVLTAITPRAWLLAWLAFMPLTYEVLNGFASDGSWQPAAWPLWVIGCSLVVAISFDVFSKAKLFASQDRSLCV